MCVLYIAINLTRHFLCLSQTLVKAVGMGTNLKVMGGPIGIGMPRIPGPVQMSSVSPNLPQMGKLPSSIKTNIKSASLPYR